MEGSTVEGYMLSITKKSHHWSPAQTLYFLTYYTATKNSFTLLEITIGQEKMHGLSAHPPSQVGPNQKEGERGDIGEYTDLTSLAAGRGWRGKITRVEEVDRVKGGGHEPLPSAS